jgi:phospholipid/cholesterol/gamma-HCH transport system substrate-binding protein
MKKYANEFKVGVFFILCVVGLFYLLFSTGKLDINKKVYHINVIFDEIAGLAKKAPVMLNGFEVGKVDDIRIAYDGDKTKIILRLLLEGNVKIRENAVVSIKTLGLMGEKYIQIASNEGVDFIQPGATLEGKPYQDLDALMEEAQIISTNVQDLAGELKVLVKNFNSTVDSNKDTIDEIIKNLEVTSKNFEEFSADIKRNPWKLIFKQKEKKE